ncbi:MAG: spore maturation protein [Clostridia bacterium]|nr:spore maturation protein [Clostridia bacterium]
MAETLSALAMPLVVVLVGMIFLFGKKDYFDAFTRGATDGLHTTVKLLPTLVALMVAVSMLNASGAVTMLSELLSPLASAIGIPSELLPLLVTRPFSGSASTAAYSALLDSVGADSFAGLCASVIFGSSDTVVYVIAVYFSSVNIRKTRWAFPCAFAVMLFCIFFSCFFCRLWFF